MSARVHSAGAAIAVAMTVVLLAACGSSDDETPATTAAAAPAATAAATTAEATTPAEATTATEAGAAEPFILTSTEFGDNEAIPQKFTCQGAGVSPTLRWSGVPEGTKSLALLVVDPDAAVDGGFTHWVLAGIDPSTTKLDEGSTDGAPGASGAGEPGYAGPCPPSGVHHYVFTLYALPEPIEGTPDRAAIEAAAATALGQAVLTGTYEKT
jgi:Raf kinase inhibitor-like YbhB/YbcL family protein